MSQLADEHRDAFIGAHVDPRTRAQLLELARAEDRSLASVLRRAIDRELDRGHQDRAALEVHAGKANPDHEERR